MGTIANILNKYVIEFDWLCCAIANSTIERDEFLERKNKLIKKAEKDILDEIEECVDNCLSYTTECFDSDGEEYSYKVISKNELINRLNKLRGEK